MAAVRFDAGPSRQPGVSSGVFTCSTFGMMEAGGCRPGACTAWPKPVRPYNATILENRPLREGLRSCRWIEEEYVEQAYFFQTLRERMQQNMSTQDLLDAIRQEILATTMLPFAIDFMAGELRLTGGFATAMARLPHYFTPFQTYVVGEAEKAEGRFDFRIALEILQREAEYRAAGRLAAGHLPLPVRDPLPQPPGLRPRAGGHGRRPDLRRRTGGSGS